MITTLLAVIAAIQLARLLIMIVPITKKKHFKDKIKGTERLLWGYHLKQFQTELIKEEKRVEYDQINAKVDTLKKLIAADKNNKDAVSDLEKAEHASGQLKKQLVNLDAQLYGIRPSQEYPEGVSGLKDQIESLKDLVYTLKQYVKSL